MDKIKIGGIMQSTHLAKIGMLGMPDRPGLAAEVLNALGEQDINVQFIVQCIDFNNQDHIVLCVSQNDLDRALAALENVKQGVEAKELVSRPDVGIVSIFGPDFRERPAVAGAMFRALAEAGINILAISTSISTISCVIDGADVLEAVTALRKAFEFQ